MNTKNLVIAVLAVGVFVLGGFLLNKPVQVIERLGANAGPDHYEPQTFWNDTRIKNPVHTGTVTAVTPTSTVTLTNTQVCDSAVITHTTATGGVVSASTTLPSATNLFSKCLTTNGDTYTFVFRNLGSAASTTYLVAGASTTLVGRTANDDVVDGGSEVLVTLVRASASEVVAILNELVAAD